MTTTTPAEVRKELQALGDALSAPSWAQGPGGNVSVKHEGALYVKASGTRLTTVATDAGHVAVDLADALRALDGDPEADARVFAQKPRPSLETYFHAIGPRVVAHTHPVAVLLAGCSSRDVADLESLRVPVVPYQRPGRGLALAVKHTQESHSASAFLLASHGLLVIGETADEAIAKSRDVEAECRRAFGVDLATFDDLLFRYQSPGTIAVENGFARHLPSRAHLDRYLFPDAVVYASVARVRRVDIASLPAALAELGRPIVVVDESNERVAFAKTRAALDNCIEVLAAHDWVEAVLTKLGLPNYLPQDEPEKILDLPSEKYRMKLE